MRDVPDPHSSNNVPVRVVGTAQHYDWGSANEIPALLGVSPDGRRIVSVVVRRLLPEELDADEAT